MFGDCPVEVFQSEKEFSWLLEIFRKLKPTRILEIGSLFGGTLWHWMKETDGKGFVISIDKPLPVSDERFGKQSVLHRAWWDWAASFKEEFLLIEGDSTSPSVVSQVKVHMPEIDFLFIDGDHREEAVRRDFENYSPLVRDGGVIAFHDIAYEKGSVYYGVKPLWEELKAKFRTEEMIEKPGEYGIGVLYK
jgi:cephalosporin hydroxylase